jgi:class 3 adenylate cyclase/alpha-beta hydrolase superfamily lysophospholipase
VPPVTRYATSGDVSIAYQVHGDGPLDLLFVPGLFSHLEVLWEEPGVARMFDRLGSLGRLILLDRRGNGMSDAVAEPPSIADELADIDAVLDAAGSERAVLTGYTTGGAYVMQYAVARPERVQALCLYATFARTTRSDDLPWADTPQERAARLQVIFDHWGEGSNAHLLAPSLAGDPAFRAWFARLERLSAGPGQMRMLAGHLGGTDVRALLGRIAVPTLVLHRSGDRLIDVRHSRYLAERIPGARYVELDGEDNLPSAGDTEAFVGEIEEFLTGGRSSAADRRLLTVLFTDIVDGTRRAAELGDRRWRDLLAAHDTAVRRQLARFGGREVKTTGDGFLAVFDGAPSVAVRAAAAIAGELADRGVRARAGLHTGECELIGDDVGGMAVHIAARVCGLAGAGEVLASGTTFGTVVGAGLGFEDAGAHELRGVPGLWPIFRVVR